MYDLAWEIFQNPTKMKSELDVKYLRDLSELDEFLGSRL
jgi:hypothetical protein